MLKFEEGDLVKYVRPRARLHLHLRLNALAIVVKTFKASEALENYKVDISNYYIVEWQKDGEQNLVFEGECELAHCATKIT